MLAREQKWLCDKCFKQTTNIVLVIFKPIQKQRAIFIMAQSDFLKPLDCPAKLQKKGGRGPIVAIMKR